MNAASVAFLARSLKSVRPEGVTHVLAVWRNKGGEMMHVAKENLAGSGYNAHAVGRNPGLWTAEYSIVKDAVMQQELDAMKAKLDAAGVTA